MFTNLKNKIKEELGSDVSTVIKNTASFRTLNRHLSQTGSTSSVSGSQISLDESKENTTACPLSIHVKRENSFDLKLEDGTLLSIKDIERLENREDEWRKRMQRKESELIKKMEKKEEEYKIKLFEREKEWKKIVEKHEKEKTKLIENRLKTESAKSTLEIALNNAEDYKKKLYSFQENAEQIEGFQTQEMAKIKHLLLAREQDVEDKTQHLKIATSEIENLKAELSRLRRYEVELNSVQLNNHWCEKTHEDLIHFDPQEFWRICKVEVTAYLPLLLLLMVKDEMECLRHYTQRERIQLSSQLAQTEEEVRHLKDKVFVLEQRLVLESTDQVLVDDRVADLMRERTLLERKLEETHLHLSDIKTSWSGKISSLEMQVGRLSRQAGEEGLERRRVEQEKEALRLKIKELEKEIEVNSVVIATKDAKLLRMAEDIDEMATELKELRANVDGEVEEFKRQIVSYRDVQ